MKNMNLLRRARLLEKCYQSLENYSSLTRSRLRKWPVLKLEDQLRTRFLNFLGNPDENKNEKNINREIESPKLSSQNFEISDTITNSNSTHSEKEDSDYEILVNSLKTFSFSERTLSLHDFSIIDLNCCKFLGKLSKSEILQLLHLFVRASPIKIIDTKFYKSSLLALKKFLDKGQLDNRECVQLLFFSSMGKKLSRRAVKFLMKSMPPLRDLSLMERCIFAHSIFVSNVRLEFQDLRSLEETLEKNASKLVKDPPILSTICKAVRQIGPTSDFSLTNLSNEIIENEEKFTLMSAAHILSLYVEANDENSSVTNKIFHDFIWHLSQEREKLKFSFVRCRIKDVDRLLWASSNLNYKMRELDKIEISSFVDRRFEEFAEEPFILVNTLLTLWILDCKLENIVKKCLTRGIFELVNNQKEFWKPIARLQLLLNCIKIESPGIKLPDEFFTSNKIGMKIRKSVKNLHGMIEKSKKNLDIDEATIDCPVDGIYIAGVSLKVGKKLIHIDLLDETTCFKGSKVLNGLARLKIRLLEKIGYESILITEGQLRDVKIILSIIKDKIVE